ncbi:MAG TPA: MarC family protein, partial [Verrucomicrobiae bacterium]
MNLVEYSLLALSSLFVIVDPLAVIPAFITMTADHTPAERKRTAKTACVVMTGVLLGFAYGGQW